MYFIRIQVYRPSPERRHSCYITNIVCKFTLLKSFRRQQFQQAQCFLYRLDVATIINNDIDNGRTTDKAANTDQQQNVQWVLNDMGGGGYQLFSFVRTTRGQHSCIRDLNQSVAVRMHIILIEARRYTFRYKILVKFFFFIISIRFYI